MPFKEEIRREAERLQELKRYEILDTPNDGEFDDITALAAKFFGTPIAIVSLVDEQRVWFKSACGLGGVNQIDRGPGLCASAIMHDGVYVAEDLRRDPNSLANPLVANENGFRFYAAAPLKTLAGFALGTMCVLDNVPRQFSKADKKSLEAFARLVMSQMELRLASRTIASMATEISDKNAKLADAAHHDALTGLLNRRSMDDLLSKSWKAAGGQLEGALLILDVDRFKSINDVHGHPAGDAALVTVANRIKAAVRASDFVGRYGGEEFIVFLAGCDLATATQVSERIRQSVEDGTVDFENLHLNITISGGLCHGDMEKSIPGILKSADKALYTAKQSGRNKIVCWQSEVVH